MQQVQLQINEQGLLNNQRYAFSNKYTLVSELMQNARRAGASRVEVEYDADAKLLTVFDDGAGIDDFQKLLTLHESGWNEATCRQERPFGIGFSKCLYAATRCVVSSGGKRIDFETDHALDKQPIDVNDAAYLPGTLVALYGVDLPKLKEHIAILSRGFAIPVFFNGVDIARPYALCNQTCVATEIGHVALAGCLDGKSTRDTIIFLQGFCVLEPAYCNADHCNVVHLDSTQFVARLPDRDKLIDENDQRERIKACLSTLWREVLLVAKERLSSAEFVELFYEAARSWRQLDLFNDVPLLPRSLCDRIVGYPVQERYGDRDYLKNVDAAITRADVEQGVVVLVDLGVVAADNTVHWMFARARGFIVFHAAGLHDDHWVRTHVRLLEHESIAVAVIGEQCRTVLEGRWIWPTVVLCDAVSLTVGDERVEITDDGLYDLERILIPKGEQSGEPVRQASDFVDGNDQFLDGDLDADRNALCELIHRLRAVDPQSALASLLRDAKLEKYPLLKGKTFRLTVGSTCDEHAIELVG